MAGRSALPDCAHIVTGEETNLAFQEDEVVNGEVKARWDGHSSTSVESPETIKSNSHGQTLSYDMNNGQIGDPDMQKSCTDAQAQSHVKSDVNGLHNGFGVTGPRRLDYRKLSTDDTDDIVNSSQNRRLSNDYNSRKTSNDTDNTICGSETRRLSNVEPSRKIVDSDKPKLAIRTSPQTIGKNVSINNNIAQNGNPWVSSPEETSSIQSPYTESVCLQMLDGSFDSSAFISRSSTGSDLESSVTTRVDMDGIIDESEKVTDIESMISDDVFNTTIQSEYGAEDVAPNPGMDNDVYGFPTLDPSPESRKFKAAPSPKQGHKFKKIPVPETGKDRITSVYKRYQSEKRQLLANTNDKTDAETLPSTVPDNDEEHSKADVKGVLFSTTLTKVVEEVNDSQQDDQLNQNKTVPNYHVTHPREYETSPHDNRHTLVMSDDIVHCQFIDNDYDVNKERRARLSICCNNLSSLPPRSKDYVHLSCLVMFCCNPLFGIIAFSFSIAVNSTYESGQYDKSSSFSKWSFRMSALGIAVSCFVIVVLMIFYWPDNFRKPTEM